MKDKQKEHWIYLCERALNEQNPECLMQLVSEIDRLLEERELRLKKDTQKS